MAGKKTCIFCEEEYPATEFHFCTSTERYAETWKEFLNGKPLSPGRFYLKPLGASEILCRTCHRRRRCDGRHCAERDI